jgi:hypothetical protein
MEELTHPTADIPQAPVVIMMVLDDQCELQGVLNDDESNGYVNEMYVRWSYRYTCCSGVPYD